MVQTQGKNKVKELPCFLGVLANVNENILKVPLEQSIEVKKLSLDAAALLIANLENSDSSDVEDKLYELNCVSSEEGEEVVYLVINQLSEIESQEARRRISTKLYTIKKKFETMGKLDYVEKVLSVIRLIGGGHVCMPLRYFYQAENPLNGEKTTHVRSFMKEVDEEKSSLTEDDIILFKRLIDDNRLSSDDLQFSLSSIVVSHEVCRYPQLAFVVLVTGFESLFNENSNEITETISRSIAVLLSKDRAEGESLYKRMKEVYKKRSKNVHGVAANIDTNEVVDLRQLLRKAIMKIVDIDKDKKELNLLIRSSGYGSLTP